MRLFVGDDWAEDHHDVELMDAAGRVLARARLPEGVAGIARLHGLIGLQLGDAEDAEVVTGIETDRRRHAAANKSEVPMTSEMITVDATGATCPTQSANGTTATQVRLR